MVAQPYYAFRRGFTPVGGRLLLGYFRVAVECLQLADLRH
jgi:hypothetical protein